MQRPIAELQEEILAKLPFGQKPEPEVNDPIPILSRIVNSTADSVQLALGKVGQKICNFADDVDLKHPHVRELFLDLLQEDKELLQDVDELLQLSDFAIKNNITKVLSAVGAKVINREKLSRTLIRTIDSPFNNRHRIRLLKERADRDALRGDKRMQAIDMTAFSKKGEDIWASQPDNFSSFIRFSNPHKEDIAFAEKKELMYLKNGCVGMANYIRECIDNFKSQLQESYYGFNRITMTNAAVILAKSLGFKFLTTWNDTINEEKRYRIKMPSDFISNKEHPIWLSTSEVVQHNGLVYEPRVYPLSYFWSFATPTIKNVIDCLESFPETCGKAIFDNFIIICPGPAISSIQTMDSDVRYSNKEDAAFDCDKKLMESGKTHPVLLGEKDGRCFFICFWG